MSAIPPIHCESASVSADFETDATAESTPAARRTAAGSEVQAAYVSRMMLLSRANNIAKLFWYAWDAHGVLGVELTEAGHQVQVEGASGRRRDPQQLLGLRADQFRHEPAPAGAAAVAAMDPAQALLPAI